MRLFLSAFLSMFLVTGAFAQENKPSLITGDITESKEALTALMVIEKVVQCQSGITVMRNMFIAYGSIAQLLSNENKSWAEVEGKLKADWNELEGKLKPVRKIITDAGLPPQAISAIETEVFQTYTQRQHDRFASGGFQRIPSFIISSFKFVTVCVDQSTKIIDMFFKEDNKKGEQ